MSPPAEASRPYDSDNGPEWLRERLREYDAREAQRYAMTESGADSTNIGGIVL